MFSIYQDAKIAKSLIKINFKGEDAAGHGVTQDVNFVRSFLFSFFWYSCKCSIIVVRDRI